MNAQGWIYASFYCVIIGSGNGLLHVWHQAITWIDVDLMWSGPLGTNLVIFECKMNNRINEQRSFDDIVGKLSTILAGV